MLFLLLDSNGFPLRCQVVIMSTFFKFYIYIFSAKHSSGLNLNRKENRNSFINMMKNDQPFSKKCKIRQQLRLFFSCVELAKDCLFVCVCILEGGIK